MKATAGKLILAGVAALAMPAHAGDIFQGMRWPTSWQLDERVSYSTNGNGSKSLASTSILKYIDGDNLGKFFFLSVPYKSVSMEEDNNVGAGDVSVGIGPRGRKGNLNWIAYGALTLPTGKSGISNSRCDKKAGLFATYLGKDRKFEVDGSFEYNSTEGKTPDEITTSLIGGGKTGNSFRVGAGLALLGRDNGDYSLGSRYVARYVASDRLHLEAIADRSFKSSGIPGQESITVLVRYSF